MPAPARAQSGTVLKPYVVIIFDTSGSMILNATGAGTPSCGGSDTRFDHAKCALRHIVDSYGDMVMALARYRMTSTDTNCADGCNINGVDCRVCQDFLFDDCDPADGPCTNARCTSSMRSADRFQLLTPLIDDNLDAVREWVDLTCSTCTTGTGDNELFANGYTPIAGSLSGARRYYQGLDPDFTAAVPGGDPIRDDPLKSVFVGGAQCRPYLVILLTDGFETCAEFPFTTAAAANLLSTPVDGSNYRIITKVIGFGLNPDPCADQIEDIAHAGGTPDVAGQCEGYYADNEEELSLALSTIIADALKFETCNNADDDCDGNVDEGFQKYCNKPAGVMTGTLCANPGDPCNGVDDNCFMGTTDEVHNACGGCGPVPSEVCNGADDNCNGAIDEGGVCGGCVPDTEICNGEDDDCDDAVDEDLTRPCGTDVGICTAGTETCDAGEWVDCTGTPPNDETCNNLDDDCDGVIDGIGESCVTIPGNNPGVGICRAGNRVCTAGVFDPTCVGEVGPETEACDSLDNDCDGTTDEDIPSAECGTTCGVGMTACVDGELVCEGGGVSHPEECNGLDDDCDGTSDEEVPSGGDCSSETVCNGELLCIAGSYQCIGTDAMPEICDCADNDCDDSIDEEPPSLCLTGSSCVHCQCAFPCDPGEFPCPVGRYCSDDDYCLVDRCFGVDCPPDENGDATTCVEGDCVRACDLVDCVEPMVCRGSDGTCQNDDCIAFPEKCAEGELCVSGVCVADPCAGVECPAEGEYCFEGDCVGTCAGVECPAGETCRLGDCEPDPCAGVHCDPAQVCDPSTQTCVDNECLGQNCPTGEACNPITGACEDDPCAGIECPGAGEVCRDGSCYDPNEIDQPDAGPPPDFHHVTAGGGGCNCDAGGGGGGGLGAVGTMLLALAVGLLLRVSRRRPGTATLAGLLALGLVLSASGCNEDSYCLDCADGRGGGGIDAASDGGGIDGAGNIPDAGPSIDACVPTGAEVCDGKDNDCNGTPDDGDVAGVGDPCGTDDGECVAGTTVCVDGSIECGGTAVNPTPEICDGLDNDCVNGVDNGDPGGNAICGSDVGDCKSGITHCVDGGIVCTGEIDVSGTPESCDGRDNNCNGEFDEGAPGSGGDCGTDTGDCEFGTVECIGGVLQCQGGTGPTLERCNTRDDDCDGDTDEDFDLDTDRNHCGDCDNVCVADNATPFCDGGGCAIAACDENYWDVNGDYDDGCEYGPCVFAGNESCNDDDDDCDMMVDEDIVPPPNFCNPNGECAGTVPTCTPLGWVCEYDSGVSQDAMGNIIPEIDCDGRDNDCDGGVDETFPALGDPCDDGELGVCRGVGVQVCNPSEDGVTCMITDPGMSSGAETCNGLDDDCDGTPDDGDLNAWVAIMGGGLGGTRYIFAYEASRPDATATADGILANRPCSKPTAKPWINITHPQAEAQCAAIGARLCTEQEWQRACETSGSTCTWSYNSACTTYSSSKCNGNDFDTDAGLAGDQDDVLPTGQMANCFANWSGLAHIFDLSGNVKEWTQQRSAGVNPLRGGSSNNTRIGISCQHNFTVADDEFLFPNVGFRCCRSTAPPTP